MKFFLASLVSLMVPTVSAGPFPAGADPIELYKNVRSTLAEATKVEHGDRNLQLDLGKLTTRCFTECITLNMTPSQCVTYIQLQVSTAVGGHEVGPLTIKVREPRSPEVFADTYWLVEVPVNLLGRATCDRNMGKTFYPFGWELDTGSVPVAPVDCLNVKASECCRRIRAYGMSLGMDKNDMCLACFPHQEPLVPRVATNANTGLESVVLEDYLYDGTTCFKAPYSEPAVVFFDDQKRTLITNVVNDIDAFLSLPAGAANCGALSILMDALYDATVTVPQVQEHIGRLSCGWCWTSSMLMDMEGLMAQLQLIRTFLDPMPDFDSTERCVIIYTDAANNIVDIPKIGGSRADDEFDDDCPPDATIPGVIPDGPSGGIDLDLCLQTNAEWSTPCLPGFIFDDLVNDYVCPATSSLVDCTGEAIDHSLEFVERIVVDLGGGVFKTQFIYKACTPELTCNRRQLRGADNGEVTDAERKLLLGLLGGGSGGTTTTTTTTTGSTGTTGGGLLGGLLGGGSGGTTTTTGTETGGGLLGGVGGIVGGVLDGVLGLVNDLLSPMNSISIGMTGKCVVTDFAYIALDVDTPIAGAEIEIKVADIGLNSDTCIAGFTFTADWSNIQSTGCSTGSFCRNIMLEVDGIAPAIETQASISFSNAFTTFPIMGPNCTLCEPETP